MSGNDSDVDLDRLAEYAAGLLDPEQAAEVERLVAAQPAWAQTLAALTAAQPLVRAALAGLASPPVPDDVVARLEAALPAAAAGATVVDISEQRRARRPRRSRIAVAATAVAAGAVICVAGLNLVRSQSQSGTSSSGLSAGDKRAAPAIGSGRGPLILSSGRDYTPQTVDSLPMSENAMQGQAPQEGPSDFARTGTDATGKPSGLSRLASPADLQICLGLLASAYQRAPTLVDYAHYQGRPALVVVLSGASGREVVVVGPNCGLPGSGTDQIYAAPVR
jgi:hypothetical protein